jgi:hypothetical protein
MNNNLPNTTLIRDGIVAVDRRRAGRSYVAPSLIPLLRNHFPAETFAADPPLRLITDYGDGLDTYAGISLAVGLSIPIWIAIGWVVYLLVS